MRLVKMDDTGGKFLLLVAGVLSCLSYTYAQNVQTGSPTDVISTGIISSTAFHTQIVQMYTYDTDNAAEFTYSIKDSNFYRPGKEVSDASTAFDINKESGALYTGLPTYRDYEGGYFEVNVEATDGTRILNSAQITIYIMKEDEEYKYVFSKSPNEVRDRQGSFFNELERTVGGGLKLYANKYYYTVLKDGSFDNNGAELCFMATKVKDVMDRDDTFEALDMSKDNLREIYRNYNVVDLKMCNGAYTTKTWSDNYWAWWLLIALGIALFILALLLIACIASYWQKYRNRLTLYKPYVVLDPVEVPQHKEYQWQETTVKMG